MLELEVLTGDGRVVTLHARTTSIATSSTAFPIRTARSATRCGVTREHGAGQAVTCGSSIARLRRRRRRSSAISPRPAPRPVDFVDGVVFGPRELVTHRRPLRRRRRRTRATTRSSASTTGRSASARTTTSRRATYIWRWDTDWFWCSKNLGAQNPAGAAPARPQAAQFDASTRKVMRWNSALAASRAGSIASRGRASGIGDPGRRRPDRARRRVSRLPACARSASCRSGSVRSGRPIRRVRGRSIRLRPGTLYVNFGFWDVVRTRATHPPGSFQPARSSARSPSSAASSRCTRTATLPREEFWAIYDKPGLRRAEGALRSARPLPDLYDKCVLRH